MVAGPRVVGDGAIRGKENKFFFVCGMSAFVVMKNFTPPKKKNDNK